MGKFFVRTEPLHLIAKDLMKQWHSTGTRLVTTNYILLEMVALMISPLRIPKEQQVKIIETIKKASWVEIIHLDFNLDEKAWMLLKKKTDKKWSLVDCASFVIMHDRNITRAFTTDHHFEQAGFQRMLK